MPTFHVTLVNLAPSFALFYPPPPHTPPLLIGLFCLTCSDAFCWAFYRHARILVKRFLYKLRKLTVVAQCLECQVILKLMGHCVTLRNSFYVKSMNNNVYVYLLCFLLL